MNKFKFSLISDMHVDFPQPKTPYDQLEKFVVAAGDTSNGLLGLKFLQKLKRKGHDVFAVDGNHEHYGNMTQGRSQDQTERQFFEGLEQGLFRDLGNGLIIIGANGWYPVTDESLWTGYMNDGIYSGLMAAEVNKLAEAHAYVISATLKTVRHKAAIIVTHTAPCLDTLNPAYEDHYSNEWYWNPHMREVLSQHRDQILVWCHGHTHAPNDKLVDGVRVVCNPRGYPGENPGWGTSNGRGGVVRNRYPGQCYRCGETVYPCEGFFEKISDKQRALFRGYLPNGQWLHQHARCCATYRGSDHHFAIPTEVLTERRRQFEIDNKLAKEVRAETALGLAKSLGWPGSNPISAIRWLKREGHRI